MKRTFGRAVAASLLMLLVPLRVGADGPGPGRAALEKAIAAHQRNDPDSALSHLESLLKLCRDEELPGYSVLCKEQSGKSLAGIIRHCLSSCSVCQGQQYSVCRSCTGQGVVRGTRGTYKCDACAGTGNFPCKACRGRVRNERYRQMLDRVARIVPEEAPASAPAASGGPAPAAGDPPAAPPLPGAPAGPPPATWTPLTENEAALLLRQLASRFDSEVLAAIEQLPRGMDQPQVVAALSAVAKGSGSIARRTALVGALGRFPSPTAVRFLLDMLPAERVTSVREPLCAALGATRDRTVVPALMAVARQDKAALVRAAAISALGDFQDNLALEVIGNGLGDENAAVREAALTAIRKYDRALTLKHLVAQRASPNAFMRGSLIALIGECDPSPEVLETVYVLLGDPDPAVRQGAIAAAARFGDYRFEPKLEGLAMSDPSIANRQAAADALRALRERPR
ncbi:MAG: HEAT repeat domain-containing protein [Planctomycetes bacterium]|nr:HEAT repeat domain-containing protein [Planctomycetota bacterium]